jgi:LysR family glycine cleavage system transcriptional activator
MARLPLHTLPAFRTLARLQNLRAAAEQLHLTHSAVSQQLRLLEEQIGFRLFDRNGRRIVLNAAGSAFLRAVEPALAQLDEGLRIASAAASGSDDETLRVTSLPSFAQRWLLPRMGAWRDRHPQIALELHASQQVVDLERDGYHAALRTGSGPWRGLVAEQLLDSPWIVVGSPLAARRLLGAPAESLAHEPLLGDGPMWQRWFALVGPGSHQAGGRIQRRRHDAAGRRAGPRPGAGARSAGGRRAAARPAGAPVDGGSPVRSGTAPARSPRAGAAR